MSDLVTAGPRSGARGWLAAAALVVATGAGCTSGNAEAEGAVSASAAVSAKAGTVTAGDEPDTHLLFARKRVQLATELARIVEESDEQFDMIMDTMSQREATRDRADEDPVITRMFTGMEETRAILLARRAAAGEAIARLRLTSEGDFPRASWAARMVVDDLEVAVEAAAGKLYK